MPLSTRGAPREKTITFRAAPEIAGDLRGIGFGVLSLANNHSFDYGPEALAETVETLRAHGIASLGAGQDRRQAEAGLVVDVGGWRIGFLAWSCLLPSGSAAGADRPGLAPLHIHTAYEVDPHFQMEEPGIPPVVRTRVDESDVRRAGARVRAFRKRVDFLAISVHWGFGAGETLAEYQQPLGRTLIEAGADVVLGNHVHAVHGVERYRGKLIFYSPGNFIAQQPREQMSDTALAILDDMSPDGYLALLSIDPESRTYAAELVPVVTNDDGLPELATGGVLERIVDRLQHHSAGLGTELLRRDDRLLVEADG